MSTNTQSTKGKRPVHDANETKTQKNPGTGKPEGETPKLHVQKSGGSGKGSGNR